MSETAQGSGMWCAFTPQMAYEVWRDSERDEAEGETRWHLLADEINKRLAASPRATQAEPGAVEAHARYNRAALSYIVTRYTGENGEPRDDMPDWAHAMSDLLLFGQTDVDVSAAPRADATAEVIDPSCTSCNGTGWWGAVEQYCQCADGRRAAAADATAGGMTEVLIAALRDIATNYDHDEQTREHTPGYGGACRVCTAEAALRAAQPTSGGDDA